MPLSKTGYSVCDVFSSRTKSNYPYNEEEDYDGVIWRVDVWRLETILSKPDGISAFLHMTIDP